MSEVTNKKVPVVVRLSDVGLARLKELRQRLGLRRSGVVLKAVRVCAAAHGCTPERSGPLYTQAADGTFQVYQPGKVVAVAKEDGVVLGERVVLMYSLPEKTTVQHCAAQAGDLATSIETATQYLEELTDDPHPPLYEQRGGRFYQVV